MNTYKFFENNHGGIGLWVKAQTWNRLRSPSLHRAVERSQFGEVRRLLDLGHNPNASDIYCNNALHYALSADVVSLEMIKLLIGANTDPRATNGDGETPLDQARNLNLDKGIIDELERATSSSVLPDGVLGFIDRVDDSVVVVRVENAGLLEQVAKTQPLLLFADPEQDWFVGQVTRKNSREVHLRLFGTIVNGNGGRHFDRNIKGSPGEGDCCLVLKEEELRHLMYLINGSDVTKLNIGTYIFGDIPATIDAVRLFQRSSLVVGQTGSGKSWLVSVLLEKVSKIRSVSPIIFDVTGEYCSLRGNAFQHLRIAQPADIGTDRGLQDGVIYLPYWFLDREALISELNFSSDTAAAIQVAMFMDLVLQGKRRHLEANGGEKYLRNLTCDRPFPYDIGEVLQRLKELNEERIPSKTGTRQGSGFSKFHSLIARLSSRLADKELGFIWQPNNEFMTRDCFDNLMLQLLVGKRTMTKRTGGVTIIDCSQVPIRLLPLVVGSLARALFELAHNIPDKARTLVPLFVEEAHNSIPSRSVESARNGHWVEILERVAKEGRKRGLSLVAISQNPSELNPAVCSQTRNILALRLARDDDRNMIGGLPACDPGLAEILSDLNDGEVLVGGDATAMPLVVRTAVPKFKPRSRSIGISHAWNPEGAIRTIKDAIEKMRLR